MDLLCCLIFFLDNVAESFAPKGLVEICGLRSEDGLWGVSTVALTFKDIFLWSTEKLSTELLENDHIIRNHNLVWGQQIVLQIPVIFINKVCGLIRLILSDAPGTNENCCSFEVFPGGAGQ